MNIVSIIERNENEMGYTISRVGGSDDGEEWRQVKVAFDNGDVRWLWKSSDRPGVFKQVFVPWNNQNKDYIE